MKRIASLILALGLSMVAMAQNTALKGVVRDNSNQPVIGAFVVEQGTNNGTVTGVDGEFVLTAPRGANVEISCIGYIKQVIVNNGAQDLVVVLEDD
ncbi:MAG: carboxypeptidase-like regulatory domain-containing protein, partial [Bacteroidales bacterium]|nr:carboxypeptidase-like regulatory domain-containing protein [Bacteroidales bacterium]